MHLKLLLIVFIEWLIKPVYVKYKLKYHLSKSITIALNEMIQCVTIYLHDSHTAAQCNLKL